MSVAALREHVDNTTGMQTALPSPSQPSCTPRCAATLQQDTRGSRERGGGINPLGAGILPAHVPSLHGAAQSSSPPSWGSQGASSAAVVSHFCFLRPKQAWRLLNSNGSSLLSSSQRGSRREGWAEQSLQSPGLKPYLRLLGLLVVPSPTQSTWEALF